MIIMKLKSKRFSKSSKNIDTNNLSKRPPCRGAAAMGEIQWELRPGGMLVQKRESSVKLGVSTMITVRVSAGAMWHDVPIEATSTFGELKVMLSMVTSLEPIEQRLLFKGKEREDTEHLHMVGVGDKDKVLLLQDPATKERKKLLGRVGSGQPIPVGSAPFRTISV